MHCDCPQVVSSVSAFKAKAAKAQARFEAESPGNGERPPLSVLPGDVGHFDAPVSKLPGDQYLKTARQRAFTVFSSMREMLAAA